MPDPLDWAVMNADDVRHSLRIGFQPSITSSPDTLAAVTASMAATFVAEGVTVRRVRNAAAQLHNSTAPYVEALIAAMGDAS